MHDPYETKQREWSATYTAEYRAWIASLTDAERAALPPDLLEPDAGESKAAGYSEHDMAEDDAASEFPDIVRLVETATDDAPAPEVPTLHLTQDELNEAIWDVVRRIVGELLSQKNAKLAIEVFALVSGVSFLGDSMTEVGKRNGVGRAAVSKRACESTAKLGVAPSRAMRTLTARKSYRTARRKRLAHNERKTKKP